MENVKIQILTSFEKTHAYLDLALGISVGKLCDICSKARDKENESNSVDQKLVHLFQVLEGLDDIKAEITNQYQILSDLKEIATGEKKKELPDQMELDLGEKNEV